jgi:squalene synthase HpnC
MRAGELRSGKDHRDENFPVASWLIRRQHRPAILAFYEFVRVADDIADHPSLGPDEKLARLDQLEASLVGNNASEPEGANLRDVLRQRGLSSRHAQDLLNAFRQDVHKNRYANWQELVDYCTLSAMPVGRFVLDVHGESRETWHASDPLCAALQIINHLQDCAGDYTKLDRVYIPLADLAAHGAGVEAIGAARASPALRACLDNVLSRTAGFLEQGRRLPDGVSDTRLACEIAAIGALADRLIAVLKVRDPLRDQVHLSKAQAAMTATEAVMHGLFRRMRGHGPARRYQTP